MEYVYAAMLLHKAGKEITEDAVKKILTAAGVEANDAKIKALVAALDGVNIEEAIKKQAVTSAPAEAQEQSSEHRSEASSEKKEEKKEEKKDDGAGAAGLGALFG